jgi:CHAT domain-containing protein
MSFQDVADSAMMLRSVYKGTMKDFFERGQRMMKILDWLWRVAVRPVLDVLAPNAEGTSSGLPRLWWIPVGLLSRFPFHAAMEEGGDRNARAYERVMSCYAPSLKSLRFIRDQSLAAISRATSRFLAITVEETGKQGYPKLAGVNQEALDLATIFSQTPEDCILHRPTAARALKAIQDSNLVHFACHGESDPVNPSDSRLILVKADPDNVERIDPLTVGDLMNGKTAHGGIAFLRACFTADNSAVRLIDEVSHLASAFQLAGFSHVFGTMWNTRNSACAEVIKRFYLHLLEPSLDEHPHHKVAKAFHMAVKEWMDSEGTYENPLLWASFVHYGA